MAINKEFKQDGHTYLYRIKRNVNNGPFYAELRILREKDQLGDTIFAQPQLVSYQGPGQFDIIDKMMRDQALSQYGIKIPKGP